MAADIPWNSVFEMLSLNGKDAMTVENIVSYRAALKYSEADAMLAARTKES
jgi:hypothetical protein